MSHAAVTTIRRAEDLLAIDPYVGVVSRSAGATSAISFVASQLVEARLHYEIPCNRHSGIRDRFVELTRQWQSETKQLSSVMAIALHPAYQSIIGLGPDAVPLILEELRSRPNHWFWALRAITGIDPVPVAERGRLQEMTKAWLKWGEEQELI